LAERPRGPTASSLRTTSASAAETHDPIYGALSFALLVAGRFTFVYWAIRVPAAFHYGWFPTMPWNS
jgi:hypothetical protein